MSVLESFSIATLSAKSRAAVRISNSSQRFELIIKVGEKSVISRSKGFRSYDDDVLTILFKSNAEKKTEFQYQQWKLFSQDFVPVEVEKIEKFGHTLITFWDDTLAITEEIPKYLIATFKKLSITLDLGSADLESFYKMFSFVKDPKLELKHVLVGSYANTKDEVVETVLHECRAIEQFSIVGGVSENFYYDLHTRQPFNFNYIHIERPQWVTKDHMIKLFLTCERVRLEEREFEVSEIRDIVNEWVDGCRLKHFEVYGKDEHYQHDFILRLSETFPIKIPIPRAKVYNPERNIHEDIMFPTDSCFLITRTDGSNGIIYEREKVLFLTTDFEMG
ncbi:unnamed protein product [Caenorhabditis brenneri]